MILPHTLPRPGPRALITSATPVAESIRHLEQRYFISTEQALERLRERYQAVQLLGLYHDLFPQEFATSTAAVEINREELAKYRASYGGTAEPHTPREEEFFTLVDQHLFPLPLDWLEQGVRFDRIMFQGPCNHWEKDEGDYFTPALQLAGMFLSDGEWTSAGRIMGLLEGTINCDSPDHLDDDETEETAETAGLQPAAIPYPERLKFWTVYERLIKQQDPPLCYMDDAINVMAHATGVSFIDASCLCGSCEAEVEWTRENIGMLIAEHRRGQEIFRHLEELDEWIKESPRAHIEEMVILFNFAAALAGILELRLEPRRRQLSLFGPN